MVAELWLILDTKIYKMTLTSDNVDIVGDQYEGGRCRWGMGGYGGVGVDGCHTQI